MIKIFTLLVLVMALCACESDKADTQDKYTVTLTGVDLNKKGSSEVLAVEGLPASGATLTQK